MYLLDSNVISELRKPKPNGAVVSWIREVDDKHLFISALSIGEIQSGIEITRQQDKHKADELEKWLLLVANAYNVLPMDTDCFMTWAKLIHQTSDTLSQDAMIASTAKVHQLCVVTRNISDFKGFNVPLFNPFDGMRY